MAKVPPVAVSAAIRTNRPVLMPAVAHPAPSLATADEHRLRGAATVDQWQVAVDELAVGDGGHAEIVDRHRDNSLSRWSWNNGPVSDLSYPAPMAFRDLVSPHALREAADEGITLEEMEDAYVDPDVTRASAR